MAVRAFAERQSDTLLSVCQQSPLYIEGVKPRIWEPGFKIVTEGNPATQLTIVHKGEVFQRRQNYEGTQRLALLHGPVLLGTETLAEEGYFSADIITRTHVIGQVLEIGQGDQQTVALQAVLEQNPRLLEASLTDLASQTRDTYTRLGLMSFAYVYERAMAVMAQVADQDGRVDFNQTVLADLIGMSRGTLNQLLISKLTPRGVIEPGTQRGRYVIRDLAKLRAHIDGYFPERRNPADRITLSTPAPVPDTA